MKQCTGSLFISADGVLTMRTSISLSCAAGWWLGTALVPPRPLRLHRILHRLIAPALPGAFFHSITSSTVDGLNGGTPFELALDLRRDAALLAARVDLELVIGRGVVAAIAG